MNAEVWNNECNYYQQSYFFFTLNYGMMSLEKNVSVVCHQKKPSSVTGTFLCHSLEDLYLSFIFYSHFLQKTTFEAVQKWSFKTTFEQSPKWARYRNFTSLYTHMSL